MSIQGVNQIERVFVSPAAATQPTVPADGTTLDLDSVVAGTGLPLGGITWRTLTTNRDDNAVPTSGDFQCIYKDLDGKIHRSNVIKQSDIVSSDLQRAAVAPTEQVSNLTIGTATAGAAYVIKLRVPGYGGLLGACDEVNFYGTHTATAADTTTTIATALFNSLKTACDKAPEAFATVSNPSAGVIRVTGVAQPYDQARWSGRQVNFALSLTSPDALVAGDDGDTTIPVVGNGNYNQVAGAEEFYAGENEGYKNRFANWPAMTTPTLAATAGQVYTSDSITFTKSYGAANSGTQKQTLTVYYQE